MFICGSIIPASIECLEDAEKLIASYFKSGKLESIKSDGAENLGSKYVETRLLSNMIIIRNAKDLHKIMTMSTCVLYFYVIDRVVDEVYSKANEMAKLHPSIKFYAIDAKNPVFRVK